MMKRVLSLCILLSGAGLTACGSIYIRDPTLTSTFDEPSKTFSEASYTKVFDDELLRLADYRARDDLTTARLAAARRDADLQDIAGAADQTSKLAQTIQRDWEELVGAAQPALATHPRKVSISRLSKVILRKRADVARDRNYQEDARRALLAAAPEGRPPTDLACKDVLLKSRPPAGASDPASRLWRQCDEEATDQKVIDEGLKLLGSATEGSPMAKAVEELEAAEARTSGAGFGQLVSDLKPQIEAAEKVAKEGAVADLGAFRAKLGKALGAVSPVAKIVGLDHIAAEIDKALVANVCDADAEVDKAIKEAAKCGTQSPTSTTAKADAVWSFWEALASLSDAADQNTRSAAWLSGAKAIVEAAKADAKLEADRAKAIAAAKRATLDAAVRQASALASAQLALDGASQCKGGALPCALVYYADSRNLGAAPRAILTSRELQIALEYDVRRERGAAQREGELIKAASAQIKAYVNGGVDPALIVQFLFGAGLIGVAAQ